MKIVDTDIASLNLECVSYKACRDEGWSLEKVDQVENEYRVFLQIIRDNENIHSVAPTLNIDKYWHYHILDTAKYHDDCNSLFGQYVHHFPYSGVFGENDASEQNERVIKTVNLIKQYLA